MREYEMIIEKKKMERERERERERETNNTCYNWPELLKREKLLRLQNEK